MEISDLKKMKILEDENGKLKKIVAEQVLDIQALKLVLSKKW
jgi:putative transposase